MLWMSVFSGVCVVAAIAFLYAEFGPVSIHLYIAAAGGVFLSVLLAAALMGLVFLSNGTGHDQSIIDPMKDHVSPDDEQG